MAFATLCSETPAAIRKALDSAVNGDYYEFGVYSGFTLYTAWFHAKKLGLNMRFFGFDSFAGLPEVTGIDAGAGFQTGQYACGIDEVTAELAKRGVDWRRLFLIKGFYSESLKPELKTKFDMKLAAVVLVDCDIYASTVPALAFMESLFQEGTIILFDDWNCFGASDEKGERKAWHEFAAKTGWKATPLFTFGWHGQAFKLSL